VPRHEVVSSLLQGLGDEDDETVEVFNLLVFNPVWGDFRFASFKATRVAIETRLGAKVLEGTAQRVLRSELDAEGRYRRIAVGWW